MIKFWRPLLVLTLILALAPGSARAAKLWWDFDHDNSLATIQPRTARDVDSLTIVMDFTGLTLTPPFTFTIPVNRNAYCVPNGGDCVGALPDLMPLTQDASVDSSWLEQNSAPCQPLAYQLGLRFTSLPASPVRAIKMILSWSSDPPLCTQSNVVCFGQGVVGGQGIGPPGYCVKVHDFEVPVSPESWGSLRRKWGLRSLAR